MKIYISYSTMHKYLSLCSKCIAWPHIFITYVGNNTAHQLIRQVNFSSHYHRQLIKTGLFAAHEYIVC